MIITKKAIPRRTFLRGLGAAVALPLLDSMSPAFAAPGRTAAPRTSAPAHQRTAHRAPAPRTAHHALARRVT